MEYSIRELANLSGVTPRTLRWYDKIGLLKPSRVAESGYRFYGPAEVNRLQDILFYRALGVELAQIKTCLDDPSYDRLAVLRNHLSALTQEQLRLERLIQSVTDTIHAEERKERLKHCKPSTIPKKEHTNLSPQEAGKIKSYSESLACLRSGYQIPLPLKDEDGLCNGNFPVCRRSVSLAVELRGVRFIFLEHIVDGREQHPGDGDNGLFMSPAFLECKIAIADFRKFFGANCIEGTLHQ